MLISVCLPTYNGVQFLRQAVESVLTQSHAELELLVCDDGSSDGTFALVQELAASDGRLKYWQNDSRLGVYGNYNRCLDRARGALIKPFAQDDLLMPTALEEMAEVIGREPEIELVCVDRHVNGLYAGDHSDDEGCSVRLGEHMVRRPILECLKSYRNLIGEPVAVMFRASAKGLQFKNTYRSLGDLEFWLRILEQGDLYRIEKPLVTFMQHSTSETMSLLKTMEWVPDFYHLSREYEHYLHELGLERDEYCMRFTELAGGLIEKMRKDGRLQTKELDGFAEVAYFALRRCAELGFKSREYDSVVKSTSWRITKPLRMLMGRGDRSQ